MKHVAFVVLLLFIGGCGQRVPEGWTCDPKSYDGNSIYAGEVICDCECGEYDPDCGIGSEGIICHESGQRYENEKTCQDNKCIDSSFQGENNLLYIGAGAVGIFTVSFCILACVLSRKVEPYSPPSRPSSNVATSPGNTRAVVVVQAVYQEDDSRTNVDSRIPVAEVVPSTTLPATEDERRITWPNRLANRFH